MGDLFKAFQKKHEVDGKTVFKKSLQFYLDALNGFSYKQIKMALDEELESMKKEIQQTKLLIAEKINSVKDCTKAYSNGVME